jgi:hypothetical protein
MNTALAPRSLAQIKFSGKAAELNPMPTLLDRYQNGECEAVWSDLESIGSAVYQEQYLTDARAVAEETMKRVRHNAELVATRLSEIGYEFATQKAVTDQFQLIRNSLDFIDGLPSVFGQNASPLFPNLPGFPTVLQDFVKQQLETLHKRRPEILEKLSATEENVRQEQSKWTATERVVVPPSPSIADDIAQYEAATGGPIPLSLKAWCEIVGSVHLTGTHPTLSFCQPPDGMLRFNRALHPSDVADFSNTPKALSLSDPLDISPTFNMDDADTFANSGTTRRIILGCNDKLKARVDNTGEPFYSLDVPSPATADAPFRDWHDRNFVGFLRIAFDWGGFPGWERYTARPEKELAYLKEGLLRF